VQRYDPRARKWATIEPMLCRRTSFVLHPSNGYLYAIGGRTMGDRVLKSAERLDISTGQWEGLGEMHQGRVKAKVVELDGDLYVIGGEVNVPWFERRMDRFDRRLGLFLPVKAPMVMGRSHYGICAHNGCLWALGGWGPDGAEVLRSCERYKPGSGWEECPQMRAARYASGAVSYNGNIYAIGGEGRDCKKLMTVERFDEGSREWVYVTKMNSPRSNMYCFIMQDSIYVFGGGVDLMNKNNIETGEYYKASTDNWISSVPNSKIHFSTWRVGRSSGTSPMKNTQRFMPFFL